MTYELQYTSAERTLQVGVKGFGPVVATRGLPAALEERLVALSGYRHLFAGHEAQSQLNPVNHSHLIVAAGGKTYHVLSRICDAGFDHSRRSNKFAHHIALEAAERVASGPAALVSAPGCMATSYAGTPQWLAGPRRLPMLEVKPAVCRLWQQQTGDAGWAGVLAQSALVAQPKPVVIVFQPGFDPLPLIAESLSLLPAEQRWRVTFSTYFNKLPPGIDCLWRCMPCGDAETKAAGKLPQVTVLDLTRPLGRAPSSPWVEAARTGKLPAVAVPKRQPGQLTLSSQRDQRAVAAATLDASGITNLASDDLLNFDPLNFGIVPVSEGALHVAELGTRQRNIFPYALAAAGVVLATIGVIVWQLSKPSLAANTVQVSTEVSSPAKTTPAVEPPIAKQADVAPENVSPTSETTEKPSPVETVVPAPLAPAANNDSIATPPSETITLAETPKPSPTTALAPLRRLRRRELGLTLPEPPLRKSPLDASTNDTLWSPLVELPGVTADQVRLSLTMPAELPVRFTLLAETRDGEPGWTVLRETGNPAGDDELARLRIHHDRLEFRWLKVHASMRPELLGKTQLNVELSGQRESIGWQYRANDMDDLK